MKLYGHMIEKYGSIMECFLPDIHQSRSYCLELRINAGVSGIV